MANLTTAKAITFLDIETTHLDPKQSAVLSISIVTDWDNGQQDVWTTKIKPASIELEYASEEALNVCKYSAEEWKDAIKNHIKYKRWLNTVDLDGYDPYLDRRYSTELFVEENSLLRKTHTIII